MKKNVMLVGLLIGLVGTAAVAQEVEKWISGARMEANLFKGPRYIGGSSIVVSPEVLNTVGTNSALVKDKFYVLQPDSNWVLADGDTGVVTGLVGFAHGVPNSTVALITDGMIIGGTVSHTAAVSNATGTIMYLGAAGGLTNAAPTVPRAVAVVVGTGTLRLAAQ